jgi:ferric-dicitrate binding protein FerR (iron transport regulator)
MSDRTTEPKNEASLTRLLRESGRGPTAAPDARARIHASVQERWRASLAERARAGNVDARPARRWLFLQSVALAASVAVVALVIYSMQGPTGDSVAPFAMVTRAEGDAQVRRNGTVFPLRTGRLISVRTGDTLTTADDARVALELEIGYELRINAGSELVVTAADEIELRSGAIYFDSNELGDGAPLVIATPLGSVRHVGTQFEASVVGVGLRIRVREGRVTFSDSSRELVADAGEQVEIGPGSDPERTRIATDDPAWQWTEDLAMLEAADTYRLPDVLTWVARETGRELRFADAATRARVQTIMLYDLDGLTPRQTLDVLGSTTAFEYRNSDGSLLVTDAGR